VPLSIFVCVWRVGAKTPIWRPSDTVTCHCVKYDISLVWHESTERGIADIVG